MKGNGLPFDLPRNFFRKEICMKNIKLSSIFVLSVTSYGVHASFFWFADDLGSLSKKDIERVSFGMSIPRPLCPFNGQPTPLASTNILFNWKTFYFHDTLTKRAVIEALTGQYENLDIDVIQHLAITRGDFDNLEVTLLDNDEPLKRYLLKIREGKSALELSRSALIVLLRELGEALGLSDEEILEKINLSLGLKPTE
ncbi:MAG: hypothetical protein LBF34_04955 [Puniceicoccales bacterium]|jgi:hypothetical protein|nr:hypothetical protein [Puniceicoccales bacterium]